MGSAQVLVRESCGRSSLFGPLSNVNVVVGGWHSVSPVICSVGDVRLELDSVADILLVSHLAESIVITLSVICVMIRQTRIGLTHFDAWDGLDPA